MKTLLAGFLTCSLAVNVLETVAQDTDAMSRASLYPVEMNKPATGFFEGALLGNGGMGVVVTTRPDAVCLHFGHNNVWDIRVVEENRDKIGTFKDVFSKAAALPADLPTIQHDPDFAGYLSLTASNYHHSYPRPFPCGTLILGFDRREVELLGHSLDISNGLCRIFLDVSGQKRILRICTDMEHDEAWLSLTDEQGNPVRSCFNRIRILADPSTPGDIPHYRVLENGENSLGFYQELPYSTVKPEKEKDKAFALQVYTTQPMKRGTRITTLGIPQELSDMERWLDGEDKMPLFVKVRLQEGPASLENHFALTAQTVNEASYNTVWKRNLAHWNTYWAASSVYMNDKELEAIWYRNMYFLNCALRPGVTCPGIFANWSYGDVGTAWHGDYHLNYNTQQPFWVTFSSNHLDKNLVYADLVDHLLPVSRMWARDYYGMRGAFFPHSGYPVEMHLHPYPVPDWGWEVFETPWMVQGLWWHYLYSGDEDFLRRRAFEPIKDAVMFLTDYMTRDDAHGERWGDDRYHIFPSVPPELYGLQPGFKYNYDTQIDLALAKFVFKGYLDAVKILGVEKQEKTLCKQVRLLLDKMPEYPVYDSERYGKIYVSVPGEGDQVVYNVPANLTHVFPGEEYGLSSPDSIRQILLNTCEAHQNEGGNDIVFIHLQKARLGVLDMAKFKRQVRYATLPNQTVTDAVLQIGGRYSDVTDYMYMGGMGIWFENFALPAVINECLMQSYDGVIRLFPNWEAKSDVSFRTLRARGAFLVSADLKNGQVECVKIHSERGGVCRLLNPWDRRKVNVSGVPQGKVKYKDNILELPTVAGGEYVLRPE